MISIEEVLVEMLCGMAEFRDADSQGHIGRIQKITEILARGVSRNAREYSLTEEQIKKMKKASALHDIGKIAIPDRILFKPGKLTADEYEIIKTHTTRGSELVKKMKGIQDQEFYQYCYDIVRSHHEKYDGSGYPDGLKGEQIPLAAQIVSVADMYDVLVSERVYKQAFEPEKAMQMIIDGECGVINMKILETLQLVGDQL